MLPCLAFLSISWMIKLMDQYDACVFLRILQTFVSKQWRKIKISDVEKESKYSILIK